MTKGGHMAAGPETARIAFAPVQGFQDLVGLAHSFFGEQLIGQGVLQFLRRRGGCLEARSVQDVGRPVLKACNCAGPDRPGIIAH